MKLFSVLRLASLLAGLGFVFRAPIANELAATDHDHLSQHLSDAAAAVVANAKKEEHAIKLAGEGINCLAGAGPCPSGQRSPLK